MADFADLSIISAKVGGVFLLSTDMVLLLFLFIFRVVIDMILECLTGLTDTVDSLYLDTGTSDVKQEVIRYYVLF